MATDLEKLVVQLSADIKGYEKALNKANGVTNSNAKKIEKRFAAMNSSISSGWASVGETAAKAFAIIGGAKGIQSLLDSSTKITNALKVAGLSGDDLASTFDQLFSVAQKNSVPIEALAELYSRVSINQKELGVSSGQLVGFTDDVGKALRVSGTSAEEAQGPLLQLSQALGSGTVHAEEFNSILEGMPALAQAAAKGIKQTNGSVAALKQLVVNGKLSSRALFDGIVAGASDLDDKLRGSDKTISQTFTNLYNSAIRAAGEFNASTKAANTFGAAIQGVATFIDGVNFDNLITEISKIAVAWGDALEAANHFAGMMTEGTFLPGLAQGAVSMLPGDSTVKRIGGSGNLGTTIYSTDAVQDRIDQAFAGDITKVGDLTEKAIRDSVTGGQNGGVQSAATKAGRIAASKTFKPTPIDLSDPKYAPTGSKTGAKGHHKSDPYKTETDAIQKRTAATVAETAAQAKLNPLIDDYGFAVAKAKAQSDLESAAKEANKKVTPELAAQIDNLSTSYANAEVAARKLDDAQQQIKERQQEIIDVQKDVTRGIVDGFVAGESAAQVFSDALSKIGSKLLDMAFDDIFNPTSNGGLDAGGFIANLFKGFASGGYTGPGGKNTPAGIVHKGEYVIPKNVVDKLGVGGLEKRLQGYANGGLVGSVPRLANYPRKSAGSDAIQVNFAPVIDNRGASVEAVARTQQQLDKLKQELPAHIVKTIREAKKTRQPGIR